MHEVTLSNPQTPAPIDAAIDPKPDRAAINRANAQKSTGPKTAAGKQRSSLNALRHGLTGQTVVMPNEDLAAYQKFVDSFHQDLKPRGAVETQLTQSLADAAWRLNRARAMEDNLFSLGIVDHEHRFPNVDDQIAQTLAMAECIRERKDALNAMSMHEQRLSRQFERDLKLLRQLQSERAEKEEVQLCTASRLLQKHEEESTEPYDPAADGFVFTIREIEDYIHREQRKTESMNWAYPARRAA